jgi:hypothetical protein
MALVNAACDGDVTDQTGQIFFEAARLAPSQRAWAASVWLERANHNHFNTMLPGDPFGTPGRPDCDPLLDADAQRAFLASYAGDFLTAVFSPDPAQVRAALERMGIDVAAPAADNSTAQAAQAALLADVRHRLPLLTPAGADDIAHQPGRRRVTAEGVTTFFCPDGYYTPTTHPELADCHRAQVTVPGQPPTPSSIGRRPAGRCASSCRWASTTCCSSMRSACAPRVDPLAPLNRAARRRHSPCR